MRLLYRKFIAWLEKQNLFVTCLIFLVISCVFSQIGDTVSTILGLSGSERGIGLLHGLAAILVAPFIETAIFQMAPYDLAYNKGIFKNRDWLFITLFSAIFGIVHFFSPAYILFAFFTGISFIWAYIFAAKRGKRPFVLVTIVHAIRNAMAVTFQFIDKF